jgi:hypothetical protein
VLSGISSRQAQASLEILEQQGLEPAKTSVLSS